MENGTPLSLLAVVLPFEASFFSTSDRSDLFSSSRSLSFFCRESSGKKVGVDKLFSAGRALETHEGDV